MSDRLFKREANLILKNDNGRFEYSGLRFAFDVKKNIKKEMNTAKIEIYNLREASRHEFELEGSVVNLQAGYETTISAIFKGHVDTVKNYYNGPDLITQIIANDGDVEYRRTRFDKSYPAGASIDKIVKDISTAIGLPLYKSSDVNLDVKYGQSVAFTGLAKQALDTVCNKLNVIWSIQDGVLQLVNADSPNQPDVILINKNTGMIHYPTKTKEGIQFKSLMLPALTPGRKIKLESEFINGDFIAQNVSHIGDVRGTDFMTECEAIS